MRLVKRQIGLDELSTPVFGPAAAFSETFSAFRSLFSEVADMLSGPSSKPTLVQSINTKKEEISSPTGDSKKQDLRYLNLLKYEADTCVDGFENKGYLFAPGMLAVWYARCRNL